MSRVTRTTHKVTADHIRYLAARTNTGKVLAHTINGVALVLHLREPLLGTPGGQPTTEVPARLGHLLLTDPSWKAQSRRMPAVHGRARDPHVRHRARRSGSRYT
jgi:hypothetical protein